MTAVELPMFPLGSVLLPGMAVPLRIFEPRYLTMMRGVLAATPPRFGVVLIERGSEVGGGDTRTDVGCTAVVLAAEELTEGQMAVVAIGSDRFRVERWLPDDPHPRALVSDWPDESGAQAVAEGDLNDLEARVAEVVDLATSLTGSQPPTGYELNADPERRVYELATLAPLGPLDRLRLLAAPGLGERVPLLAELVHEQRILLEARHRFGEG
jgi:uncharacterized protein